MPKKKSEILILDYEFRSPTFFVILKVSCDSKEKVGDLGYLDNLQSRYAMSFNETLCKSITTTFIIGGTITKQYFLKEKIICIF